MAKKFDLKSIGFFLVKVIITAGIIYYLLQKIELKKITHVMFSANPLYIFLAIALAFIIRYITACQTRILLAHQKVFLPTFKVFSINLISSFYTLFLPGDLSGSVIKWHKLSKPGGQRAQAFSVIAISRLINTLVIIGVGLIALMINNPFKMANVNLLISTALVISLLLLLPIFNKPTSLFVEKYFINTVLKFSPALIEKKVEKTWSIFKKFQELSKQDLISVCLLAILIQVLGIINHYVLASSIDIKLSIIIFAWLRSATAIIQMLPISISGLGVREGTLFFLLSKYNVAGSDALAFSFLLFGMGVIVCLVGGVFELKDFLGKKPA